MNNCAGKCFEQRRVIEVMGRTSQNGKSRRTPEGSARVELIEELYRRYQGRVGKAGVRRRFVWKKYAWLTVVRGAGALKRLLDVVVSTILLVFLAPLFAVVALLVKATDGGPAVYWQARVGKWGREFEMPKFRSMVVEADKLKDELAGLTNHEGSLTFKMKDDPRVTWIGRVLRRFSIDELPQLWCVLKGDMTLVGPRPPLPGEVARYTLAERRRLDATPGLTCLWQVSGRSDIPFDRQVALDVEYIESQSLWLDFAILLKTIPAVLLGRGAY